MPGSMPDASPPPSTIERRSCRAALALLFAAFLFALWQLASIAPTTSDELVYLESSVLLERSARGLPTGAIKQGPLPLQAQRLLRPTPTRVDAYEDDDGHRALLIPARRGMLVFPLITLLVLARWAWLAFGPLASVLVAALYVTDATVLGHGHLTAADGAMTSGAVVTLFALWRWLESPGPGRALLLGAVLGAALATKYVNTLLVPVVVATCLLGALAGVRARAVWTRSGAPGVVRRLADLVPTLTLVGAAALITLHASYLGWAGFYDAAATPPLSASWSSLVDVPGLGALLTLLPDPMARGLDFDLFVMTHGTVGTGFLGRSNPDGHVAYYVAAMAMKLSLVAFPWLVLAAWATRSTWTPRFALVWLLGTLTPLIYLSGFTRAQIGVRYTLPTFALLALAAGGAVTWLRSRWGVSRAGLLVTVSIAALVADAAAPWPFYVSDFNLLAGSRPYEWFNASTYDWCLPSGQREVGAIVAERHPGTVSLHAEQGPRFGLVAIHGHDVWAGGVDGPGPKNHWCHRFVPIDRVCGVLVFDTREDAFRATLDEHDPRDQVDLAVALLDAGRPDEAAVAVAVARGRGSDDRRLAALEVLLASDGGDRTAQLDAWLALGHPQRVLESSDAPQLLRAQALVATRRLREAQELLEAQDVPGVKDDFLLALVHQARGDLRAMVRVLRTADVAPGSPQEGRRDELLAYWAILAESDYATRVSSGLGRTDDRTLEDDQR